MTMPDSHRYPWNIGLINNMWDIDVFLGLKGEEGQPQHFLIRATFSSFSRPNHLKILVLPIYFFFKLESSCQDSDTN